MRHRMEKDIMKQIKRSKCAKKRGKRFGSKDTMRFADKKA